MTSVHLCIILHNCVVQLSDSSSCEVGDLCTLQSSYFGKCAQSYYCSVKVYCIHDAESDVSARLSFSYVLCCDGVSWWALDASDRRS